MRATVIAGLCVAFAGPAIAGDGNDVGSCNPCFDVDDTLSPTPIYQTVDGSTSGQPYGEYAYYFCAVTGGVYTFTFCEGGGSATYDTVLSVRGFNNCGAELRACNDDFCGLRSHIEFISPGEGNFIVVVQGFDGDVGKYRLAYRGPSCAATPTEAATWGAIKAMYN